MQCCVMASAASSQVSCWVGACERVTRHPWYDSEEVSEEICSLDGSRLGRAAQSSDSIRKNARDSQLTGIVDSLCSSKRTELFRERLRPGRWPL